MEIQVNEPPLVTIAFFSYNSERFTREAVESVFAQTYSPLEIILSDDCSTDGTFAVIRDVAARYRGPHKVIVNRNPDNLGGPGHVNKMLEMARGDFIVQAEGDDICVPERAAKLVDCWLRGGRRRDLICSYFAEIDEASRPTGYVKQDVMFVPDLKTDVSKWVCGATGATASYTPKLYRKYGPLNRDVHSVDWVMPFRAWLEGGVEVVREPLLLHRTHGGSVSHQVRTLDQLPSRATRYALRRKVEAGQAAITQEWLNAWRVAKNGQHPEIERALERLIRLQSAQRDVFDAGFWKRLELIARVLGMGEPVAAAKLLYRHVLRIY